MDPVYAKARELWRFSIRNPEAFWDGIARELAWFKYYEKVVETDPPYYYWFKGGKINPTYNVFDAHPERKNKVALIWESESGERRSLSYQELFAEVNSLASSLKEIGVKKGDVVTIYMPMVPEAMVTMLAVARIGAAHSVVFAGFGSQALRDRMKMSSSSFLITADAGFRRGKTIDYLKTVKEAIEGMDVNIVTLERQGRVMGYNFKDLTSGLKKVKAERSDSLDPLFILYTSGTTGKPKGVVHAVGPYTVWAYFHVKWLFNFGEEDVFFSTPDIGWINGHSYSTYGPLLNGATVLWFEGVPDYPDPEVWWYLVEKYKVTHMWVAPTAVRLLVKHNVKTKYDISSLKTIVSAGEILGEEAWKWLVDLTQGKTYVVETWGQTENSGFITSPSGFYVGGISYKKGSVGIPLPGIDVAVVDDNGNELPPGQKGNVIIKSSAPAFMVGLYKDDERYRQYFSRFGYYYTGDYGYVDEDGYLYILGRGDDVVKVAGHRLSPAEVENAVLEVPEVAETAVVGKEDPIKGNVLVAFVTLKEGARPSEELKERIRQTVRNLVGPVASLADVIFLDKLPKTRTGKIMRRVLRAVVSGKEVGDVSTLEETEALEELKRVVKP
ncbi:MAG: acetate--CoA ligase [Candidatus Aramenus sp.]|jgi:acyl-coenzyme A synthetase/AMP-(fatty) acid ligase|nr:acetate--CoA ligase [Candidatus Aramenus sp.]